MVYERALLCALPRRLWQQYGLRMAQLVRPGGLLAGFFYLADENEHGPPFAATPARLDELLEASFERLEDAPATASLPIFGGNERWQVWRRRGEAAG